VPKSVDRVPPCLAGFVTSRFLRSIASVFAAAGILWRGRQLLSIGAGSRRRRGSEQRLRTRSVRSASVMSSSLVSLHTQLFLRWLRQVGIEDDALSFRLAIHPRGDVEGALGFWADLVGVSPGAFLPTTLKRHNPKTPRRNVGPAYRGCLVVTVRKSIDFNRRLAGWFEAIVDHLPVAQRHSSPPHP